MATEKVTYELSLRDLMSRGLNDINKKLGDMEGKLSSAQKKATSAGTSMGSAFKAVGAAILASGIVSFGKDAILATAKMQSLGSAIKFASDNATQGDLSMQWLSNFSGKWGVDLEAASEGFKTFQGAMIKTKFSSGEVRTMFEQVSKGGIAMGLSAEDTKGTFLALGQIMGKGKVQAEELRGQIGERVPGAFDIAARAMGVTTMALDKMMKDGKLLSEDFLPKFAAEMEKTFGAGAELKVDSLSASLSRSANAWLDLQVSMGESQGGLIGGSLTLWSNLLSGIADQFKTINQLSKLSTNESTLHLLDISEKVTNSLVTEMKKKGKSKKEIETELNKGQESKVFDQRLELASLDQKIKAFEEEKGGVGSSWNPLASAESDRQSLYETFPEYQRLVDKKTQAEQLSKGQQGIKDKAISNLYLPANGGATEAEKLKKQSADVTGGVPKVVNINIEAIIKDVKNNFSSASAGVTEAKGFLDDLQKALTTIILDTGIVAQYGR
jgi:tape measure domain-containing protein